MLSYKICCRFVKNKKKINKMKNIKIDGVDYILTPININNDFKSPFKNGDWVLSTESGIKYTNRFGIKLTQIDEFDYIDGEYGVFYKSSTGVKAKLEHLRLATYSEIVDYLHYKNKINFIEDDIVWFKGAGIRHECGDHKFRVLRFELDNLYNEKRFSTNKLMVYIENIKSGSVQKYLSLHLEKYNDDSNNDVDGKTIIIDNIEYKLIKL